MPTTPLVPVPGTAHPPPKGPGWRKAALDRSATLEATVLVRSRVSEAALASAVTKQALQLPADRTYLTDAQLARRFGARAADLQRVAAYARRSGLAVRGVSPDRLSVSLQGTVANFARAFKVRFAHYESPTGLCLTFDGLVHVPRTLSKIVQAILGFDTRRLTHRHGAVMRRARRTDPAAVARRYNFPPGANGRGQTVAIVELGGGFQPDDVAAYCRRRRTRLPRIVVMPIDGRRNEPADTADMSRALERSGLARSPAHHVPTTGKSGAPDSSDPDTLRWTLETTGDVELVAAFAPSARIVVLMAPDTLQGQYSALAEAVCGRRHAPTVITCSWGRNEDQVPPAAACALDRLLQIAALKGITVCASSGDSGDGSGSKGPQVQFPASSPHVLACGGTSLDLDTGDERVWNERFRQRQMSSGGGFSKLFARPAWQHIAASADESDRQRSIPDVAGKADLASGYSIVVARTVAAMGGTSAAAPMWAGLIACLNQRLGVRAGLVTPLLYSPRFKNATRDVLRGHSSPRFWARPGWNPCTGLGSPDGERLLAAFSKGRHRR